MPRHGLDQDVVHTRFSLFATGLNRIDRQLILADTKLGCPQRDTGRQLRGAMVSDLFGQLI